MVPEDHAELDAYLNALSAATWKRVLQANRSHGLAGVRIVLRALPELCWWTGEELMTYLDARDLMTDFNPVEGRW